MNGRELVAWNLRKLRVARGLSQEQLGADAEVDRTYVGGLERGVVNPSVAVLDRLAGALAVQISEFFKVPQKASPRPQPLRGGRRRRPR
jgi:transcriptional regulator with XRE-family HTH domain